jgi:hypothetical protein
MITFAEFKASVNLRGLSETLIICSYFLPLATALIYVKFLKGGN